MLKVRFRGRSIESYLERLLKKGFKRIDSEGFIIFSNDIRRLELNKNDLEIEEINKVEKLTGFEVF